MEIVKFAESAAGNWLNKPGLVFNWQAIAPTREEAELWSYFALANEQSLLPLLANAETITEELQKINTRWYLENTKHWSGVPMLILTIKVYADTSRQALTPELERLHQLLTKARFWSDKPRPINRQTYIRYVRKAAYQQLTNILMEDLKKADASILECAYAYLKKSYPSSIHRLAETGSLKPKVRQKLKEALLGAH